MKPKPEPLREIAALEVWFDLSGVKMERSEFIEKMDVSLGWLIGHSKKVLIFSQCKAEINIRGGSQINSS